MKTKVKVGVMLPQARNAWGPSEAGKGKKDYSPLGFGGSKDLLHAPRFQTSSL